MLISIQRTNLNVFYFKQGASLKAAENLGIAHARLPIDKYINMKTRKILTINHGNFKLYYKLF